MLSESSYLMAIYTYTGAACALLLYLAWWLGRHWRAGWVVFSILLLAALLLTPAHPNATVATYAPALVVAIFETLTHGPDAAMHAWKPLAVMAAIAVAFSIVLRLTVFRRPASGEQTE